MNDQNRIVAVLLLMAGLGCTQMGMSQTKTCDVEVDFSSAAGTIRHLSDVNGGPLCERGWVDLSPYYKELGIKHVRLNDVPWTFDDALNINYVFPRFEADPDQPDNYDFFQTDWYLKSIEALGIEIIYDGLGPTAEEPKLPPRDVDPPRDFEKWAKICVNIIKHYNSGWANGYHYNIKYWEIWNEPDERGFWTGTPEQYYKLYEITAKAIKKYDLNVRVGGPALSPSGLRFLEGFLKYCQEHGVPVDFVSWHDYAAEPYSVLEMSEKVRGLMTQYGFGKAESILDEWNYMTGEWGRMGKDARYDEGIAKQAKGIAGAAYDAAVLTYLQDGTVDIATFYHGTTMQFWGLFDEYGVPEKTFYSFKAFSELLGTPQRVFTAGSDREGFTVIAGLSPDKSRATVLISNFAHGPRRYALALKNLPWSGKFTCETYLLDACRNLEMVKSEGLNGTRATLSVEDFTPPSVWLFRLKQDAGK